MNASLDYNFQMNSEEDLKNSLDVKTKTLPVKSAPHPSHLDLFPYPP